ncbi:MAG TPA: thiosulfate oxidation carrier complex protein SoxZ [Pusillimonas sp.]|uniref:thiosulfate oxidation carrier complex protein SoxZ n=1 Tax=unclassified Pusillimonas TaxID=2640016 RepID=UPI0026078FCE|nr:MULTISPECIES: thiosulfate oxidation carrier complex protein SoxZ [unclassified Pusillimonas]HLU19909.1 thiosulfate oxidation carrier complex protein SoxZ [Pusillimonas sp.]
MSTPRIWISSDTPQAGDTVRVRVLVEHRMESGMRVGPDGATIARNIISRFECKFDDDLLFVWQPETAISQNPYLEFTFVARQSGELNMRWMDDAGAVIEGKKTLTVSG